MVSMNITHYSTTERLNVGEHSHTFHIVQRVDYLNIGYFNNSWLLT